MDVRPGGPDPLSSPTPFNRPPSTSTTETKVRRNGFSKTPRVREVYKNRGDGLSWCLRSENFVQRRTITVVRQVQ